MTLALVGALALVVLAIGVFSVRIVRSTTDFLVAARTVSSRLNAAAIAGEYLSLASFLGIAGLVLASGIGVLWYSVGFAAGFVALLVLVAGPLRRSGAYTVPDFAEARLGSARVRRLAGAVVLVIAWLYLVPQLKGAGVILRTTTGTPYWAGVVLAGGVVAAVVCLGGMRSATYVQAFQYAVKLIFLTVPIVVLLLHAGPRMRADAVHPERPTVFAATTTVRFETPTVLHLAAPATRADGAMLPTGTHPVAAGTRLTFGPGSPVPQVAGAPELGGPAWRQPLVQVGAGGHALFATWSLLLAMLFGTLGLPHILMRFHTSPDARAARHAAVITVGLVGVFYLVPGLYGLLGRLATPQLYLTGDTDTVAVVLPRAMLAGTGGDVLTAVVVAGAYAAFLSASCGLLLALAGGICHDLRTGTLRDLRWAVVVAAAVAVVLALPAERYDIGVMVGWAFAVSASSLCPLLVLGIWWRGLTATGAGAGLVVGVVASTGAVLVSALASVSAGWPRTLLAQPAIWSVLLAFTTMIMVSRRGRPPAGAEDLLLAMHLPDRAPVPIAPPPHAR